MEAAADAEGNVVACCCCWSLSGGCKGAQSTPCPPPPPALPTLPSPHCPPPSPCPLPSPHCPLPSPTAPTLPPPSPHCPHSPPALSTLPSTLPPPSPTALRHRWCHCVRFTHMPGFPVPSWRSQRQGAPASSFPLTTSPGRDRRPTAHVPAPEPLQSLSAYDPLLWTFGYFVDCWVGRI